MIKTLIKSTRITWAAKNVNMYLLVLTYAYFADILIINPFQILEGLVLVSALWGALYSLNDLTDIEHDRKDKDKQERPFIQEHVDRKWIILFCTIIISSVFSNISGNHGSCIYNFTLTHVAQSDTVHCTSY